MTTNSSSILDVIEDALKVITPAWPLQSTVAVNPFWNYRDQSFAATMARLNPGFHKYLLPSKEYFREKFANGDVTSSDLRAALKVNIGHWKGLDDSIQEMLQPNKTDEPFSRKIRTIAEITPHNLCLSTFVASEIGKFASAYLDENQALIKFPWKHLSLWKAWLRFMKIDRSFVVAGFSEVERELTDLHVKSPHDAILSMMKSMGLESKAGRLLYLQRAAISVLGWGSQLRYLEWQKNLGYDVTSANSPTDLLAIRIAADYLIFTSNVTKAETLYRQWAAALNSSSMPSEQEDNFLGILNTWQLATEYSHQRDVASHISFGSVSANSVPQCIMAFCIDVRSEMLRRHIETRSASYRTIGFAGFFGLAIDHKSLDEKSFSHRLPVLLQPGLSIKENASDLKNEAKKALSLAFVRSYFRNLRKAPFGSFLFVELFGIISVADILLRSVRSLTHAFQGPKAPMRFKSVTANTVNKPHAENNNGEPLCIEEKIAVSANALTHMGLKKITARLVVLVGHGSHTTNNAFGASLDCGACGGHAGDINASYLAMLLNESEVREGLLLSGISIPTESIFIAAIHETVSDEIYLLDENSIPPTHQADIHQLKATLNEASKRCRAERQSARSSVPQMPAFHRSNNWSEVRPEWGLAGNASFIVAPRDRTRGVNLSSRSFLHDYDWTEDKDFKTLELIMTAPMIVTNWINMQYFASVVAPCHHGAGNKVLHNLTNEVGVVEGNGGDLRIGLPLQSIHDGESFIHDPLRLTVFIEAPRSEIEKIISKHRVVSDLVENEWLHIVQIDSESQVIYRRHRQGIYTDIKG